MKSFTFPSSFFMKIHKKKLGIPKSNELNIVFDKSYFIPIRQKMVIAEFFDYDLNSLNFKISVHNLSNLQPEDRLAVTVAYKKIYRLMYIGGPKKESMIKFSIGDFLYEFEHFKEYNKTNLIKFLEPNSTKHILIEKV